MGRQKLSETKVEVIKYLLKTKQHKHSDIGDLFGVSRCQITRIGTGKRWDNINDPDDLRGEYLYLRYLNGKLDVE
jgi:hypothetical protein